MTSDHFGISIIEAMAAGCAPIVHKSGGPWLDILDQQQGKTGFSYSTVEEAARLIDIIMSDESLWRKLSFTSRKRSEDYSDQEFQKKLNVIVRKLSSSH
jgi:glycosyltransferase involved in cell wall biosynthesis